MSETEGVIKYTLDFLQGDAPARSHHLGQLDAWRSILHRLGLVGQTPGRYDGYGFGNVSVRAGDGFVISGTQTGRPEALGMAGYATVTACDPASNAVAATGPVKPSSESLTHGTVYGLDAAIGCVLHVHSPDIWQQRHHLGLPCTAADVPYGTPAMARAVQALYRDTGLRCGRVFAMDGHEDGVVAFGEDPGHAGQALLAVLAESLRRSASPPYKTNPPGGGRDVTSPASAGFRRS